MAFKDDVQINRNHLDKNVIDQVELFAEWSEKWANAINERDRLKERLSVVRAEADDEIRKNPKEFGWDSESKSPTEAWISNRIILHESVRSANEEYLAALHEVSLMAVAKETLEHRKKALEILTDLWKGNYFVAVARNDTDYKKAVTDKGKEAQDEALNKSERLKRRRS